MNELLHKNELHLYYDRRGNPISREVAMDIFENKNRVIALTEVGGAKVSTVHLVINHAFEPGQLLIFETMVFGGPVDGLQQRYATEQEAKLGHEQVVMEAAVINSVLRGLPHA